MYNIIDFFFFYHQNIEIVYCILYSFAQTCRLCIKYHYNNINIIHSLNLKRLETRYYHHYYYYFKYFLYAA